MSSPEQPGDSTGDTAVDALVARAARTPQLPSGEHREEYAEVLTGLERELDADPSVAAPDQEVTS